METKFQGGRGGLVLSKQHSRGSQKDGEERRRRERGQRQNRLDKLIIMLGKYLAEQVEKEN
jgi:hypothetical protein